MLLHSWWMKQSELSVTNALHIIDRKMMNSYLFALVVIRDGRDLNLHERYCLQ